MLDSNMLDSQIVVKLVCRKFKSSQNLPGYAILNWFIRNSTVADLRGGLEGRAPSGRPNYFNFMQFLGKFGKIICWRPSPGIWRPLLGEILDPPLLNNVMIPAMIIPRGSCKQF